MTDQTVASGAAVALDGSASSDPSGLSLAFHFVADLRRGGRALQRHRGAAHLHRSRGAGGSAIRGPRLLAPGERRLRQLDLHGDRQREPRRGGDERGSRRQRGAEPGGKVGGPGDARRQREQRPQRPPGTDHARLVTGSARLAAGHPKVYFAGIMGKKALQIKRTTVRTVRGTPLTENERSKLRSMAAYEGSPHHKRNPGDFGLTPPAAPRLDKTLCDEAGIFKRAVADTLLAKAIDRGLVSEAIAADGLPKQLWAVDDTGQVFEAMYGGSAPGRYHGYPIRRTDPLFDEVSKAWAER